MPSVSSIPIPHQTDNICVIDKLNSMAEGKREALCVDAITACDVVEVYSSAPVSTGNTYQDLPRLCETTDNTERYI
jgi:hypothetical protein